ncbi:MAG: PIG-L deacetylase family protein [bacterium]
MDDYDIIYEDSELHLRLDQLSRRDLIAKIETESPLSLENLKPDMLMLPSISYNQDHEAVFRAGFTAARPGLEDVKHMPPVVLSYDNPTHFWNIEREKFHPNFYVDISDYWNMKVEALEMHDSQLRPSKHFLSLDTMLHLSKLRGREIGVEAAEAYMCLRFVL